MITMMKTIPTEKFEIFHEILRSTGGRYVQSPFPMGYGVRVCYEPGQGHEAAWQRAITPINEIKTSLWKRILRKVKGRL